MTTARGDPEWRQKPGSTLVGWWWAAWVVSNVVGHGLTAIGLYEMFSDVDFSESEPRFEQPDIVSSPFAHANRVVTAVAALLAIFVVRRLTARQEACVAAQREARALSDPDAP